MARRGGGDLTAKYGVELDTKQLEGPASSAVQQLQSLQDKLAQDTKALGQMKRALRNLKGSSSASTASIKSLKDRIDAQKASIASSQERYIKLGGTFTELKKTTGAADKASGGLLDTLKGSPGVVGSLSSKVAGLVEVVGGGLVAASAAAVAGILALTAAVVVAVAAVTKYAVATANARREELLHLQGLTKIRTWYGIAAGSATDLQNAIDQVSGSVAIGRGKVSEYAQKLYRMGLRGGQLREALEGMSITGATQGDSWANRFAGMAAGANMAGQSVKAFTDDAKARLGGIAKDQMLSLGTQAAKLKENLALLFSGVHIDGFLKALNKVTGLFSQQESLGKALKTLITSIAETFGGPMVDGMSSAADYGASFVKHMVLGALTLQNKFLDFQIFILKTFGPRSKFQAVWEKLDLSHVGKWLVDGLIAGITGNIGSVVQAMFNLGQAAKMALEMVLKIKSPSRVFRDLGGHVAVGMAQGVETGTPRVHQSVSKMGESAVAAGTPSIPTLQPITPAGGSGDTARAVTASQRLSVSVGDIHVHTQSDEPDVIAEGLRQQLASVFEGMLVEMGRVPA